MTLYPSTHIAHHRELTNCKHQFESELEPQLLSCPECVLGSSAIYLWS